MEEEYCIDTLNYEKVRTVFSEKQRIKKAEKHPELRMPEFLERIKKTIANPSFIYEDLNDKERFCYYQEEFTINSRTRYTKVIILKKEKYFLVITAYRPDYIKEKGKTNLLYGKDN